MNHASLEAEPEGEFLAINLIFALNLDPPPDEAP